MLKIVKEAKPLEWISPLLLTSKKSELRDISRILILQKLYGVTIGDSITPFYQINTDSQYNVTAT